MTTTSKKKVSKKATTKKAVATKASTEIANPDMMADMFADAGVGQENIGADDLAIPRLTVLQQLSPQLNQQKGEYLEYAELGQVFNTVSQEVISGEEGLTVVPISYRRAHIEWKLRKNGGGFVADHGPDASILSSCTKDSDGRDINADGNQIVATAEYFVYVVDQETGSYSPAVISMSSTQLKKARRWNTLINTFMIPHPQTGESFNPAIFSRTYHLKTIPESNDYGSWFGWDIRPGNLLSEVVGGPAIYSAARDFRAKVAAGEVKAAPDVAEGGGEDDDSPM